MRNALAMDISKTYRYLRWTVIAFLGMLLVSVAWQWRSSGCLLTSISAYYFTPVHAVFVGSLFALGAALIAYQGHSSAEDTLLNYSGFMAFVVAMVPTSVDTFCDTEDKIQDAGFRLADADIVRSVTNNMSSLIIVTVLVVAALGYLRYRSNPKGGIPFLLVGEVADPTDRVRTLRITVVCSVILMGELALFVAMPDSFIAHGHVISATTMVIGVIAVMILNSSDVERRHQGDQATAKAYRNWYIGICAALVLALIFAGYAAWAMDALDHVILVAELIVLGAFVVFWVVQSGELRRLEEGEQPALNG